MTSKNESAPLRRSLLFVPAIRPDRYAKALATGADAVCIDLEDGVGDAFKSEARLNALDLLSTRTATKAEVSIRINDAKSDLGQQDLGMLVESGHRPDAVMLPKVAGVDEIEQVEALLTSRGLDDSSRSWQKIVSAQRLWHFESRDASAWLMI